MRSPVGRIVVVFAVLHLVTVWIAIDPRFYSQAQDDVRLYNKWANGIVEDGRSPYREIGIEYPPGVLPLLLIPKVSFPDWSYRAKFASLIFLIDAVAVLLLIRLGRKTNSFRGAWIWVTGIALLGPLSFLRIDLAPAVATLWAYERARANKWGRAGALLGEAFLIKLYPAFLFFPFLWAATRRRLLLSGAGFVVIGTLLFTFEMQVIDSVFGYHADRGIQIESTWGNILLIGEMVDADSDKKAIVNNFGAYHLARSENHPFKLLSALSSIMVAAMGIFSLHRKRPVTAERLILFSYCLVLTLLITGPVLSPQFMLWALALGAAAGTTSSSTSTTGAALLLAAVALTQYIYPVFYGSILKLRPPAVALLSARNLLLVVCAAYAWKGYRRLCSLETEPSGPEAPRAGLPRGGDSTQDPVDESAGLLGRE